MNFHYKTVVITGAANGIGESIAYGYAKGGARVVLADIDEEKGKRLEDQLKKESFEAFFKKTDVKQEKDIQDIMSAAVARYQTIDILINNAGVMFTKSPYELTVDEFDHVLHTNLRGAFLCAREAARYIKENPNGGSIVNISSTRATMSEPHTEAYAASKGGISALTHALAASFSQDHITVNSISPGWIETKDEKSLREIDHQQHLSNRVGTPKDIVKACFYLTDEDNQFVTGTDLVVDGGMTRKMIYAD
ncbi:SDR family oxidoreductase [Bacillus altitudinis]|uniref:SDR family oxidoreductase n=1 Tax=Bacillus altitudinis TaxID=293387 RepID=UPI001932F79B|nr:SDR family oxidoreductase [Bacillus altitudinis]MEE3605221.1 SDR family oxidoreductase [Bacillus altitudinis]MEE3611358.1 SDR family oxidoreductase [Bacillus altitudinis]MEE3647272.1 SDR family oxidoreductase [Bacillus altitudinis]MEE4391695.1 SDR family oxidoreductase [Bacillus altitudinis]MEE4395108.1 SDR family oxidoreductase [Bacillus altitudinis]